MLIPASVHTSPNPLSVLHWKSRISSMTVTEPCSKFALLLNVTISNLPNKLTKKLTMVADCSVGRLDGLIKVKRLKLCPCSILICDSLAVDSLSDPARASFSVEYLGCS